MKKRPEKYFNYRVIKDYDKQGIEYFSIRGVHYENFGKKIVGWDSEPITLCFGQGDSPTDFLTTLERAPMERLLIVCGNKLVEATEKIPAEMIVSRWPTSIPKRKKIIRKK